MAVLTSNPLIIESADASPNTITTKPLQIQTIRFIGATTAGHQAVVQDQNGKVKWDSKVLANTTDQTHFDPPLFSDGLKVPTLASGTLYIYLFGSNKL